MPPLPTRPEGRGRRKIAPLVRTRASRVARAVRAFQRRDPVRTRVRKDVVRARTRLLETYGDRFALDAFDSSVPARPRSHTMKHAHSVADLEPSTTSPCVLYAQTRDAPPHASGSQAR